MSSMYLMKAYVGISAHTQPNSTSPSTCTARMNRSNPRRAGTNADERSRNDAESNRGILGHDAYARHQSSMHASKKIG